MATRNTNTSTTMTTSDNSAWEPRVTRVEAGLEGLNKTVADLAAVIKDQSIGQFNQNNRIESQIQGLTVAVTNANAPRKTDWQLLIAVIFLLLAFSGIMFLPLNQTVSVNKEAIQTIANQFNEHQQLELHPVGKALLARVQGQIDAQDLTWDEKFKLHDQMDRNEFMNLDNKLQKEFSLMTDTLKGKQGELEKEMGMINDKMCQRVSTIEKLMTFHDQSEMSELRAWRNKANGLSAPTMITPLVSKEYEGVKAPK